MKTCRYIFFLALLLTACSSGGGGQDAGLEDAHDANDANDAQDAGADRTGSRRRGGSYGHLPLLLDPPVGQIAALLVVAPPLLSPDGGELVYLDSDLAEFQREALTEWQSTF